MNVEQRVINKIFDFFIESSDCNGILLQNLSEDLGLEIIKLIEILKELIEEDYVSIQNGVNPHIIRFAHYPKQNQIEILEKINLNTKPKSGSNTEQFGDITWHEVKTYSDNYICIYPSISYLNLNRKKVSELPYTRELELGKAQLEMRFFEMDVLDKYFKDPRYTFKFDDYSGEIYNNLDDKENSLVRETEEIFLKSFGLGYDINGNRVAVVSLRYLSNLNPLNQQYWKFKEIKDDCKVIREYYENILGQFTFSHSIFSAFIQEQKTINDLSEHLFGENIFSNTFEDNPPKEFTFFFIPTSKNYYEFISLLDKMISDNINKKFFKDKVEVCEVRENKDGTHEKINKGTLRLLEEWLIRISPQFPKEKIIEIIKPFKLVRKERQAPAHKIITDNYDKNYTTKQMKFMTEVYASMYYLRKRFQIEPTSQQVDIPKWLDEDNIKVF